MEKKSTYSSREKNILLLYIIDMIAMSGKAVIITVFLTSIIFKVGANLSYLSLFFPKQDFLLAVFYFSLIIIFLSITIGLVFSFGGKKEEIIKSYNEKEKDHWIWINIF